MLIHTETVAGFDIAFYALSEDISPKETFEDWQEVVEKVNSSEWVYFCAKVTASKNGIELADDYLGCCCYASYEQFVLDGDYYADMIALFRSYSECKS